MENTNATIERTHCVSMTVVPFTAAILGGFARDIQGSSVIVAGAPASDRIARYPSVDFFDNDKSMHRSAADRPPG